MEKGLASLITGPSVIFSRLVFDKIGYFNEEFYFGQDGNYWLRIFKFFDFRIVKKSLYALRIHPDSVRIKRADKYNGIRGKALYQKQVQWANDCPIIKSHTQRRRKISEERNG
jgi:hypothetical protein